MLPVMTPHEWARLAAATPLDARSLALRRFVIAGMIGGGRGHLPSALSLIEILRVLYDHILKVRPAEPGWKERDFCILSKGHGALGLYALLADKGFFPSSELDRAGKAGSILGGHPERGKVPGVEASTGALGHGLSIGLGLALGARLRGTESRSFVIMGDGEINEGSVWEAALSASQHRLDTLTAIIDYNKLQSYGPTDSVINLEPLADKWRAFGFAVRDVNGHDVAALKDAFSTLPFERGKPSLVICHTTKGKGIPAAENNAKWHHLSRISPEQLEAMKQAVGMN